MSIRLTVNGKPRELASEMTVEAYLASLDVNPQLVAVQVNQKILARNEFPTWSLVEGDVVEILRMVGGGSC